MSEEILGDGQHDGTSQQEGTREPDARDAGDRLQAMRDREQPRSEADVLTAIKEFAGTEMNAPSFAAFCDLVDHGLAEKSYADRKRRLAHLLKSDGTMPDDATITHEELIFDAQEELALARQRVGLIGETMRTRGNGISGYDSAMTNLRRMRGELSDAISRDRGNQQPLVAAQLKMDDIKHDLIESASEQQATS